MSEGEPAEARILVVDDSPINLQMLSKILDERGYQVKTVEDGEGALAIARSEAIDLIMLDINMPMMDGYEVCRELKADEATQAVPVIFISALDAAMDKVKAFESGGADYVVKPFQGAEIIARVENQLRLARLQRDLEVKNHELTLKNEEILRATEELVASYREAASVFSTLSVALPGKVLDEKYRLESLIGRGGYGAVYRANHLHLNRLVAVKVLRPTADATPEDVERFRLEGIFTCRVNHPNAIAVLDAGVTKEGIAYLVMELLEGRTLRSEMLERGRLSLARSVEILRPVCEVLAVAHATGVIHRDIKPDNIFLHRDRGGEIVKVVDFGIATLTREGVLSASRFHTPGAPVGTPAYIAPERFDPKKPYGGSSDVYSLGVMLYEMLSGEVPFKAPDKFPWAVAHLHLTEPPRPLRELNPDVPADVEALVMRTLDKDPVKRPAASELAESFVRLGAVVE